MRRAQRHEPDVRRAGWVVALALLLLSALPAGPARADEELDYGLEAHKLHDIKLTGNKTFTNKELQKSLQIKESDWRRFLDTRTYKPHLIETRLRSMRAFYRNRGFHQATVTLESVTTVPEKGDVLHISVFEGPRTMIRKLDFVGNGPISQERLREVMRLVEGAPAPVDLNAFGGDIFSIRDLYRAGSFFRASVVPAMTITPDSTGGGFSASVLYTIRPGRNFQVGKITYSGNTNTRLHLLEREMLIAEGDPLYWRRVADSRRELLGTALFRDVSIIPVAVDTTTGVADLEVNVVERRPGWYELGVGVGSLEIIRLLAGWGHNNLWGSGRRLMVRARTAWNVEDVVGNPITFKEGQLNYRGDVTFVNPRIRNSRFSAEANVYVQRETRGESGLNMQSHGFRVGTSWWSGRTVQHRAGLGLKITNPVVHPYAPDSLKVRFEEVGAQITQTRSLNWAVFVDHRDDMFQPTGGTYSIGTLQLAGGLLGGDHDFFKWSGALHTYHRAPFGGVLATRVGLGGARPYGSSLDQGPEGVPYDDRFFAGGSSSVRGYRHNSLGPQVTDQEELDYLNLSSDVLLPDNPARGGNYLLLTNIEYRVPMPVLKRWGFDTLLFFEGGNVWAQLSDMRIKGFRLTSNPGDPNDPGSTKDWDYRWSWGTGLRFQTPFGPVRVDVGFPLKRARYVNLQKDVTDPSPYWHFSLGYPF